MPKDTLIQWLDQLSQNKSTWEIAVNAVIVANGGRPATLIYTSNMDHTSLLPFYNFLGLKTKDFGQPWYFVSRVPLRFSRRADPNHWEYADALGMTHAQEWRNYWLPRSMVHILVKSKDSTDLSVNLFTQVATFPNEVLAMGQNAEHLAKKWQLIWNQVTDNYGNLEFSVRQAQDQGLFVRLQRAVDEDYAYILKNKNEYLNDLNNQIDEDHPDYQHIHALFERYPKPVNKDKLAPTLVLLYLRFLLQTLGPKGHAFLATLQKQK